MGVRSEVALRVVREHHVRFNRTGYPTLGPQEDVHPYSMIVTIADSYDALTTLRPYQRLFEPSEAITLMKTLAGSTFDPQMLERFIDMLGIYPPGTVVRLTTGEIAVVTRPGSEDSSRPWVQIVQNAEGQVSEGLEFNLMEWNSEMEDYTRSILIALDPAIRGIDALGVLRGADATPGG